MRYVPSGQDARQNFQLTPYHKPEICCNYSSAYLSSIFPVSEPEGNDNLILISIFKRVFVNQRLRRSECLMFGGWGAET